MRRKKNKVSNIKNLTVEQFNKLYPIGTTVKYYPCWSNEETFIITKTKSEAYDFNGCKMVGLEGRAGGGYHFDNIAVSEG